MGADYTFASRWSLDVGREQLWDVLDDLLATSDPMVWWPSVQVRGYDGSSMTVRAASAFGYALTFELADLTTRRPDALTFTSHGDLRGRGTVTVVDVGTGRCAMDIDWNVAADRPWMRRTGWFLRPVFVVGHHLVMRQGENHLNSWLDTHDSPDPRDVV